MSIFPMPLVPFEHYHIADDHPAFPGGAFFFRLWFAGSLDQTRFQSALHTALTLHPMLRARLRGSPQATTSQIAWLEGEVRQPLAGWGERPIPFVPPTGLQIDLHTDNGVRVWVRVDDSKTEVIFHFHHACCDGMGAMHFLETLLTAYGAGPTGDRALAWDTNTVRQQLRGRGRFGASWLDHWRRAPRDLGQLLKFVKVKAIPLAGSPAKGLARAAETAFDLPATVFTAQESKALLTAAKRQGVTVNDLLLRDLFIAIDAWNQLREAGRTRGSLCVSVPVNLRSPPNRRGTALNCVSMVVLDRTSSQIAQHEQLLRSLQQEVKDIRRWNLGLTMQGVLRLLGGIPGGLGLIFNESSCLATLTLSNMSVLFAETGGVAPGGPDAVLEQFEFFPPIRPLSRAAVGVVSYRGRLVLGLRYDQGALTPADARAFLELYASRLRTSAEPVSGAV